MRDMKLFCKDGRVQLQHIFWHVVLSLKLLLKGTEPQDGLELNFVDMHGYFKAQRKPAASLYNIHTFLDSHIS